MKRSGKIKRAIRDMLLGSGLVLLCAALIGAQEKPAPVPEPVAATKPAAASYVGSAGCKLCHPKVCEPWSASTHGKALTQDSLPAELKGCEACHGPTSIHINSGGQTRPRVFKADDAAGTNVVCGVCHFEGGSPQAPAEWKKFSSGRFARSMHGRKGLSCISCHTGHANGNDKQLVKPGEKLCLSCHGQILESAPGKAAAYTHSPVAQGQCLKCHDPHGTPDRGMVRSDMQKICQECHNVSDAKIVTAHKGYPIADSKCVLCHDPHSHNKDAKLVREKQHPPFKQGKCELCHSKPTPGQHIGLVKPAKDLCFGCHPASVMTPASEKAHPPVKEGLCVFCHSPHVSSEKALLKSHMSDLCFNCHSNVESDTVAEHRHKILEADMNCMLCHKPHSSTEEKLLVKDQMTLCGQCHKHSFSHPMAKKADGTVLNDPTTGKMLVCASCHEVHGSKFDKLTRGDRSKDLCVHCHSQMEHAQ